MDTTNRRAQHRWMFALVFALLICHELDAMVRAEWRLFPVLGSMDDDTARDVFNLAHVVLVGVPVWVLVSFGETARQRTIVVVEVFVIAHAIAHLVLRDAGDYLFEPPIETITVFGAAAVAVVHRVVDTTPWSPSVESPSRAPVEPDSD